MTRLLIKAHSEQSRNIYQNIHRTHPGDAGIDLTVPRDYICDEILVYSNPDFEGFTPKYQLALDFEISCEMLNESDQNISYMLVPRSSIIKTPLRQANSIGIIDAGYRGNIKAVVDIDHDYVKHCFETRQPIIRAGLRLFQIIAPSLTPIDSVELVDTLSSTARGNGGFGSTGTKN
jgi:dUTP pyrophosphatase